MVNRQDRRGHLVGHDEEDIRAFHGSLVFHIKDLCDIADLMIRPSKIWVNPW
jgi:hypothetical protein